MATNSQGKLRQQAMQVSNTTVEQLRQQHLAVRPNSRVSEQRYDTLKRVFARSLYHLSTPIPESETDNS